MNKRRPPSTPKKKTSAPPSSTGRRERIVSAALDAFIENGIAPTTLRDVAMRAQVDPPLIHYYFKDIEGLHLAVITLVLEDLKAASLKDAEKWKDDPVRWMKNYIRAPLTWATEKPDLAFIWVYFYTLACRPGAFRDLNQLIRNAGRERIRLKVFEGIEKGVFHLHSSVTAADAALEIQTWMTGSALIFATESETPFERSVSVLERRVFSLLGTLKK